MAGLHWTQHLSPLLTPPSHANTILSQANSLDLQQSSWYFCLWVFVPVSSVL